MSWFDGDIHFQYFPLRCLFYVALPPLFASVSTPKKKNVEGKKLNNSQNEEQRMHVTHSGEMRYFCCCYCCWCSLSFQRTCDIASFHTNARCNAVVQNKSCSFSRCIFIVVCFETFFHCRFASFRSLTHSLPFNKVLILKPNDRVSICVFISSILCPELQSIP